jgi:hypothetical protein
MNAPSRCFRVIVLASFAFCYPFVAGCGKGDDFVQVTKDDVRTNTTMELPETDPPILTKALAEQIKPGISQMDAWRVLQSASRDERTAKSLVDSAIIKKMVDNVEHNITIKQGKLKLALVFKGDKLVEKTIQGLK